VIKNLTLQCRFDGYDCYDEWFDKKCNVKEPNLANGKCDGGDYNTPECAFDGGDCIDFNSRFPSCEVENPYLIGDGTCNHGGFFRNGEQDRVPFILAITSNASLYTSAACGYDGGDCFDYLFPKCESIRPDLMGNGVCDNEIPKQNTAECAWDGGDCIVFNHRNSVNCTSSDVYFGDGVCYKWMNTVDCNFDGGDCVSKSVFPNCNLTVPPFISKGYCRPECGHSPSNSNCTFFDDVYPNCNIVVGDEDGGAMRRSLIGDGKCDNSDYNIPERDS